MGSAPAKDTIENTMDLIGKATSSDASQNRYSFQLILTTLVIIVICLVVVKIILKIYDRGTEKADINKTVKGFIRSLLKFGLIIISITIIGERFGFDSSSLVTLIGIIGLALSLALQDVLSNLFCGMTLLGTKPFNSNDFVEIDGTSGKVEEIGLFHTKLRTLDNKIIFVPNNKVTSTTIINYTNQELRRVDLHISASYDAPTATVKKAIMETITDDKRVLTDPEPFIGLDNYGDNAIDYVVMIWTKSENYWGVYYDINEDLRVKFEKYEVELTYPHINVHMKKD